MTKQNKTEDWENEIDEIFNECPATFDGFLEILPKIKYFFRTQLEKARQDLLKEILKDIEELPTGLFDSTPYKWELLRKYE